MKAGINFMSGYGVKWANLLRMSVKTVCSIILIFLPMISHSQITWSTYIGGNNKFKTNEAIVKHQVHDTFVYFIGNTTAPNISYNAIEGSEHNEVRFEGGEWQKDVKNGEVFIGKCSHKGKMMWIRYFGGEGHDIVNDLAVSADGRHVVIVGSTNSYKGINNYALHHNQQKFHGHTDGFIATFSADDGKLILSGYMGEDNAYNVNTGIANVPNDPNSIFILSKTWESQRSITKMKRDGKVIWSKPIGTGYYRMIVNDIGILTLGETGGDNTDIKMQMLSLNAEPIWYREVGDLMDERFGSASYLGFGLYGIVYNTKSYDKLESNVGNKFTNISNAIGFIVIDHKGKVQSKKVIPTYDDMAINVYCSAAKQTSTDNDIILYYGGSIEVNDKDGKHGNLFIKNVNQMDDCLNSKRPIQNYFFVGVASIFVETDFNTKVKYYAMNGDHDSILTQVLSNRVNVTSVRNTVVHGKNEENEGKLRISVIGKGLYPSTAVSYHMEYNKEQFDLVVSGVTGSPCFGTGGWYQAFQTRMKGDVDGFIRGVFAGW